MVDIKSKDDRSRNMAAIRSRNTGPEILLRKTIWRNGQRFFTSSGWRQLTGIKLYGSPDLVFPRSRLVVFVDGCFWHGCPLHYTEPDNNRDYWSSKLVKNKNRDDLVNAQLRDQGWNVLRVWEHELRNGGHETVANSIKYLITNYPKSPTPRDAGAEGVRLAKTQPNLPPSALKPKL